MKLNEIEVILFDLGNVFFDWHPKHFYKDVFPNTQEMEHFLTEI